MVETIFKALAQYGLPGILLFIVLVAYYYKDKSLREETAARIKDAQDYTTLAINLQAQVLTAVNKLSDIVEAWEKREQEREREQRSGRRMP